MITAHDLREKSPSDLTQELIGLREEQFKLRMQKASGQLTQLGQLTQVRRDIARVKTILNEKRNAG